MKTTRSGWLLAVMAFAMLSSCTAYEPTSGEPGLLRGVIEYTGTHTGPLRVGVFPTFPPRGRPFVMQTIDHPVFPQTYELRGVPEGRWFVLALVDTNLENGDRYRAAEDPGGAFGAYSLPLPVSVGPTQGADAVDVELVDPSTSSPYLR